MYVFVFDFDQTLILGHSGGIPIVDEEYDTDDSLIKQICEMFNLLIKNNIVIYINTRGVVPLVKNYLQYRFDRVGKSFDLLIKGIYGAENEEQIENPFSTTLDFWYTESIVSSKLKSAAVKDPSSRVWAFQKTTFLNKITEKEQLAKECVYFFDDTDINIEYANTCGYTNSFIIDNNYLAHTLQLVPELLSRLLVNIGNT